MVYVIAHVKNSLKKTRELFFKVAFQKVGTIDSKDGGFAKCFDEGNWYEHARFFLRAKDVLENFSCGFIDPKDRDGEFCEIDKHGAIFVREEGTVSVGWILEINSFETVGDEIGEQESFEKRGGEVATEKDALRGDEAIFYGFEKGVLRLVLDVFFNDERLSGWVAKSWKFMFVRIAHDPIGGFKVLELGPLDDKNGSELVGGGGRGGKSVEESFRIFKRCEKLIAIGEEDVLAVGLECIEFKRDVVEELV